MGLWDDVTDFLSGGGKSDASAGYDQANAYLDPYRTGGQQDYEAYRRYAAGQNQNLQPYSGAGNYQYGQINQSPQDYYSHIMQGYSESPQAKYEQEQALRASGAGAAASGMLGSGAFQKGLQQNAADISARDQQRYFGNVVGTNQMQMGYLDDLRRQQAANDERQRYLSGIGYNASTSSGQNAINQGLSNAKYDQSGFDSLAGLVGMGGQNYKNNMASGQGFNMPFYMRFL